MSKLKIVFFGTGPVSLGTLQGIHGSFDIEAVITKPPAASHGGRLHPSPVKDWAIEHGLQVYTPSNKSELSQLFQETKFGSQVGLVVDYGIIIPRSVIDRFPLGIVNSHFSLLPGYRGADPITAAVFNGDAQTGVSLMLIDEKLDEGPVLAQKTYDLPADITTPQLTKDLTILSNKLIQEILPAYVSGSTKPNPQSTKVVPTYTKKTQKSDGAIDWSLSADQIERQVRAFADWPGSRTSLANKDVTITKAHVLENTLLGAEVCSSPGSPFRTPTGQLAVCCGHGALVIDQLKPAGKNEMTGQAFLAGHSI